MKVHITHGFHENEPYSAGIKRLRSFVSSLTDGDSSINMKVFIKPETSHRRNSYNEDKRDGIQVEAHSGGTRWNPTQDQIRVLENLYKSGVKTPNAQQIEQITVQLGKYGKIEGKNVFYWFQNHKARERQKQKRSGLNLSSPLESSVTITSTTNLDSNVKVMNPEKEIDAYYRRKCRKWAIKQEVELSRCTSPVEQRTEDEGEGENRTLELFPLYPENR